MSVHRVTASGEQTSLAERKRRAGQRLIIGISGASVRPEEVALIREIQPAGFILFARNVEEPRQVLELNRELQALLPPELPAPIPRPLPIEHPKRTRGSRNSN